MVTYLVREIQSVRMMSPESPDHSFLHADAVYVVVETRCEDLYPEVIVSAVVGVTANRFEVVVITAKNIATVAIHSASQSVLSLSYKLNLACMAC